MYEIEQVPKDFPSRKERNMLSEMSVHIRDGAIPTISPSNPPSLDSLVEMFPSPVVQKAFWSSFALFYGGTQRMKTRQLNAHFFDVAVRSTIRKVHPLSPYERACSFTHDTPEDILKVLKGHKIHPVVAAYVMLDVLATVVSDQIAYGATINGSRFGGTQELTDFNHLVVGVYGDSPYGIREFLESHPSSELLPVRGEDVEALYRSILRKYQWFAENIKRGTDFKRSGLTIAARTEISEYIQAHFVLPLQDKVRSGDLLVPEDLESKLQTHVKNAHSVASRASPEKLKDKIMVQDWEDPQVACINAELYRNYLRNLSNRVIKAIAASKATGELVLRNYDQPEINKMGDNTDNSSNLGVDPTSILKGYRKMGMVIREGARLLISYRKAEVPDWKRERLKSAIYFDIERFKESMKGARKYYEVQSDNMYGKNMQIVNDIEDAVKKLESRVETYSRERSSSVFGILGFGKTGTPSTS